MSQIYRSGTGNQPENFNADDYNRYIKYFLDNEVSGIVFNLSADERNRFFEMCHRYPDLIAKVFLLPGDPLINYIVYGNEFYDALKNPHDGIDYTPSYIVAQYREWAQARGIPAPVDQVVAEGIDPTPMIEFQKQL
jgi:hypothetical protein